MYLVRYYLRNVSKQKVRLKEIQERNKIDRENRYSFVVISWLVLSITLQD